MPTRFARAAVVAIAFGAIASGSVFRTAAAAGVGAVPAVAMPIERETIRNAIQQLLQGIRDQIRRKIIGEPPRLEPIEAEPAKP